MKIQKFQGEDVNFLETFQPPGWQDIVPIFKTYTESAFCFPIKLIADNQIVGIGSTIIHGDVAWLAHIIVAPEYRKQGFGQLITQHLIDSLQSTKCETIYLIATDLGAPVYQKVGFETETEYLFYETPHNVPNWEISNDLQRINMVYYNQIARLDREVSGENRFFEIESFLEDGYVYLRDETVQGYFLPGLGDGLIIANSGTAGIELMKCRLASKKTAAFPQDNNRAKDFVLNNNFNEIMKVKRMRLGQPRKVLLSNIFNRIGGNIG